MKIMKTGFVIFPFSTEGKEEKENESFKDNSSELISSMIARAYLLPIDLDEFSDEEEDFDNY